MRIARAGSVLAFNALVLPITVSGKAQVSIDEFTALDFHPAPGSSRYLGVDDTEVRSYLLPPISVIADFSRKPLEIPTQCKANPIDCDLFGKYVSIVDTATTIQLLGAWSFFERLSIGLAVPIVIASGDALHFIEDTGGRPKPITVGRGTTVGLGDLRLHMKARIWNYKRRAGLAVAWYATAPTGQLSADHAYIGESGPSVGGHLIGEMTGSRVLASINVGGLWRKSGLLVSYRSGPQMTYAGALGLRLGPALALYTEGAGATSFGHGPEEFEIRGGGRYHFGPLDFMAGVGVGLVLGVGIPTFRIFGGVTWEKARAWDDDRDDVLDDVDACPTEAEDMDGFSDEDGCPDNDNDDDGIADSADRCPSQAEDADGSTDDDGCPDQDNDGDGVPDGYDSCPAEAEDRDGDRDTDGCPEQDRDRDGVPDNLDRCGDQPEDTDGFADEDGCPERDVDGDGKSDENDECPEQPEDRDGFQDRDGCPEPGGRIHAVPRPPVATEPATPTTSPQ